MTELPRYKFTAGDEFRYLMISDADDKVPASRRVLRDWIDWKFCVVDRDADGLWRILFTESHNQEYEAPSGEYSVNTIDADGFFELAADGRLVENWTITPLANPTAIFPRLPADPMQATSGWTSTLELDGTRSDCRMAGDDGDSDSPTCRIIEECGTQLDPIYGISRHRTHSFDIARGLTTAISTRLESDWPERSQSTDWIRLEESSKQRDFDSVAVRREADRYFAVCAEYQRYIDLALWDLPRSAEWFQAAIDAMEQFRPTCRIDFIRQALARKLDLLRLERHGMVEESERLATLWNKPADDWQGIDSEHNPRRMVDYRGKALVVLFWCRSCSWSIRTLIALNTLAAEFDGQPVAFLGVGMDRQEEDALFVVRSIPVRFPTVVDDFGARALAKALQVDSFPTTVVIDPAGMVRRIRVGYSRQLSSALAMELDELVGVSALSAANKNS